MDKRTDEQTARKQRDRYKDTDRVAGIDRYTERQPAGIQIDKQIRRPTDQPTDSQTHAHRLLDRHTRITKNISQVETKDIKQGHY